MPLEAEDLWPAGQPDPLADETETTPPADPAAPAPEAAGLPLPVEDQGTPAPPTMGDTPAPEGVQEPGAAATPEGQPEGTPEPAQLTIDLARYNELRNLQRITAEERNAAHAEAQKIREAASQLLQHYQQQSQPAQTSPTPPSPELARLADEMGVDVGQLEQLRRVMASETDERVRTATEQMQQQMLAREIASQQSQASVYAGAAVDAAMATFRSAHPDVTPDQGAQMLGFLQEMGVVDERNNPYEPEYTAEHLEIALEAVKNPGLARELIANPVLYETDDGIAIARLQASLHGTLQQGSQASPAPVTTPEQVDAALAAAHTEPGSSGAPPSASQGPSRDAFDEVLAFDKAEKRSVFTS